MFWIFFVFLVSVASCNNIRNASVTYDEQTKTFTIHNFLYEDAVANGTFQDEIFQVGWSYLEVKSNSLFPDPIQAYAAGLVEGYLTSNLLKKHWSNLAADYCTNEKNFCRHLQNFLEQNLDFINKNIRTKRSYDVYWHQIALTLEQLKGLEDGSRNKTSKPSTKFDVMGLMLLNVMGDLEDLEPLLNKTEKGEHLEVDRVLL